MLTRRQFLRLIPGLALLSGGMIYGGYRLGKCPLSDNGYCVGPCSAFLDDGTGFCLRLGGSAALAEPAVSNVEAVTQAAPVAQEVAATPSSAPTAQPTASASATAVQPTAKPAATKTPTPAPQTKPVTACPFGLVYDKYPGRCRRYVDRNGNGYCDLSEPQGS